MENSASRSITRAPLFRTHKRLLPIFLILGCVSWSSCLAQSHKSLCNQGIGRFQAVSHTHVEVTVEPVMRGGLAERRCRALLRRGNENLMVAEAAAEIDLDLFDVEMEGLGPLAAFQVKENLADCCTSYRIYSLEKDRPLRLLHTIQGGYFTGADTDLDGRVEIWAEDTRAIDGFDGLMAFEMEHPPTYALRFEKGQLMNAGGEFEGHYDDVIAGIRQKINADDLRAFKQSDGALKSSTVPAEQRQRLRLTKIQTLEIVWAYLYSGRETKAWEALHAMWPDPDVARIQTALIKARASGIGAQLDGVSAPKFNARRANIFENSREQSTTAILRMDFNIEGRPAKVFNDGAVTQPHPIYMWRPQYAGTSGPTLPDQDEWLDLLIDSAGKIRSVKWSDHRKPPDTELMDCALAWKFIPGLQHGHSVASHLRFAVYLKR